MYRHFMKNKLIEGISLVDKTIYINNSRVLSPIISLKSRFSPKFMTFKHKVLL